MSEPVTESPPSPMGNPLTRQIGPLPLWGWLGILLAAALGYWYWRNRQSSGTAASSTASSGTTSTSDIPQFVNQVYTNTGPPVAGPPGPQGPPGGQTPPPEHYPAPSGLKLNKLSNTSVALTWDYITSVTPHPTSYSIAAYTQGGKLVSQTTVTAPDTASGQARATLTGLPSKANLKYEVWANGSKITAPHSTVTGVT